jgi:hypothetical protein
MMGVNDVADACYQWIRKMMAQQKQLDMQIFYVLCVKDKLVTDIPKELTFNGVVDFTKAHQAYFYTGISGAFCAQYGQVTADAEAIKLSEQLIMLNKNGTDEQFHDHGSVQICKYGWAVACWILACPQKIDEYLPELMRMAHWFADWQTDDGSWVPSSFRTPEPTVVHRWIKTCEHVMEVSIMLQALGVAKAYKRK